jgi:hypothetical protein
VGYTKKYEDQLEMAYGRPEEAHISFGGTIGLRVGLPNAGSTPELSQWLSKIWTALIPSYNKPLLSNELRFTSLVA